MDLELLFEDQEFNQYLVKLAGKNLLSFDDYRQEVFLYLAESNDDARKVAKRIAMRMRRRQIKDQSIAYDVLGDSVSFIDAILWEDRHVLA